MSRMECHGSMCLRPVNHHKFIEVYNAGGSVNANATQLIADCYDGFQIMAHRHSELGARAMMLEIRSRRIVFATDRRKTYTGCCALFYTLNEMRRLYFGRCTR